MSEPLAEYRALEAKLRMTRWLHQGLESAEEDDLLEAMDHFWSQLTEKERDTMNAEAPRSFIRVGAAAARTILDEDIWIYRELPPRQKEAA